MKKTIIAGAITAALLSTASNAATITLTDYLVSANPGDSWTYTSPVGTVTTPVYADYMSWLPATQETDVSFSTEPGISGYFQFQESITVTAGTFTNVCHF